jgi:hypothetical protein
MASEVLVLNPRRRRRTRKAKATTKRRRRRRTHARAVHHNPRRRRRVHARRHHSRRRRVRRNPSLRGLAGSPITKGIGLAVGIKATRMLANHLAKMIPASWNLDANMARIGSEAAVTILLPMLAKKARIIPASVANWVAVGGAAVVVLDLIDTYVAPHVPLLQGYEEGGLTGYEGGTLTGAADAPQIGDSAYGARAY